MNGLECLGLDLDLMQCGKCFDISLLGESGVFIAPVKKRKEKKEK